MFNGCFCGARRIGFARERTKTQPQLCPMEFSLNTKGSLRRRQGWSTGHRVSRCRYGLRKSYNKIDLNFFIPEVGQLQTAFRECTALSLRVF